MYPRQRHFRTPPVQGRKPGSMKSAELPMPDFASAVSLSRVIVSARVMASAEGLVIRMDGGVIQGNVDIEG